MSKIYITLAEIQAYHPCKDGWEKLTQAKSDTTHGEKFPMSDILETNDLGDTLWALQCLPEYETLCRKFAWWCSSQVEQTEEIKKALDVVWRYTEGEATNEELAAAESAARSAAESAAWSAARSAQAKKLKEIIDTGVFE